MKDITELPLRGYINIKITFEGYRQDIQNSTRKQLCESLPKKVQSEFPSIEFEAEIFSLLKRVAATKSRAYGASYIYKYQVDEYNDIQELIKYIIHDWYKGKDQKNWRDIELFFLDRIGGY